MIDSPLLIPFLFIMGAAFGSFLNVLIDRLPKEESILGRSHCDYCKKKLQGVDLIPLVSFFFLRGRCRYCHKKLSFFYPTIEIFTGLVFILTWMFIGHSVIEKVLYLGIVSSLIVILFADMKYHIIPDSMQVALLVFGLALQFIHDGNFIHVVITSLVSGWVVMAPILLLFLLTKGKGMGFGDVKLAVVMGVLLGWLGGLLAIYIGFVAGGIVGTTLFFLGKKKLESKIAFGPFLVLGIVVLLFAHDQVFLFAANFFPINSFH